MNEPNKAPEFEGDDLAEDVEGHRMKGGNLTEDEDVEGHRMKGGNLTEDEDVEGHRMKGGNLTE